MKPQYLISKGLVNLLENRYRLDLSQESREKISSLEDQFVDRLGEELSEVYDYKYISARQVEDGVCALLRENHALPLVTLDDVYFMNRDIFPVDDTISITRLIKDVNDFSNKTLGPRKGGLPIDVQIQTLASKYANRDIALLDIGVFEGETLIGKEGIIPLLSTHGVHIQQLYVGIMNEPAKIKFSNHGIQVVSANTYDFTAGDWLEVRDLLGFDGRKINPQQYHINGTTQLFSRYIQDAHTLKVGAGINDGPTAEIVLNLCNMYQKKILREVRNAGYQVIEGFINSDPRLYTLEFRRVS